MNVVCDIVCVHVYITVPRAEEKNKKKYRRSQMPGTDLTANDRAALNRCRVTDVHSESFRGAAKNLIAKLVGKIFVEQTERKAVLEAGGCMHLRWQKGFSAFTGFECARRRRRLTSSNAYELETREHVATHV